MDKKTYDKGLEVRKAVLGEAMSTIRIAREVFAEMEKA
jgi:hypothetical protein